MVSIEQLDNEKFIRSLGYLPTHNYFIADKSWRPTLQLRGSGSDTWSLFTRQPHLLIFTKDTLIISKQPVSSEEQAIKIPTDQILNFDVEKLTPYKEFCISFEYKKKYYFYIDSGDSFLDSLFNELSYSQLNFYLLLQNNFNGLIKTGFSN